MTEHDEADERPTRARVSYTTSTGAGPTAPPAAPFAPFPEPGDRQAQRGTADRGPVMDASAWAAGLRSAEQATAARPAPPGRQPDAGPTAGPGAATGALPPVAYHAAPTQAGPAPPARPGAPGALAGRSPGAVLPTRIGVPGPLRAPVSPEWTLPGVPPGALTPGVPPGPSAGVPGWGPDATQPPSVAPATEAGGPPDPAAWPSAETTQAHPAGPSPGAPGAATGATAAFAAGSGPAAASAASAASAAGPGGIYDAGYGELRDPYGPWSAPPVGDDGLPFWEDESDKRSSRRRGGAGPTGDGEGPARQRPGAGLLIGILGLVAIVTGFVALPWAEGGPADATLLELREDVTAAAGPGPLVGPGDGELAAGSAGVLPAQAPGETVPPGGDVTTTAPAGAPPATAPTTLPGTPPTTPTAGAPAAESPTTTVPATARAAPASPLDPAAGGRRADFAQLFVEYLWVVVIAVAALAVVFTTLWVPRGRGGRAFTGLLVAGPVGLLANAVDRTGAVGPRVAGVAGTLGAAALYGAAVFAIFGREPAPEPALGVWVGEAGLAAVLVACLIGTRRARD